jgi:ribosome-associated translation inhibitor RaiA
MQVLVNSDHHITGSLSVSERVESIVEAAVDKFADRLTRVEVHLNDVNGPKHGAREKRCLMEARAAGIKPLAVSHEAPTLLEAINGCADKLERALGHQIGRLNAHKAQNGFGPRDVEIADVAALEKLERGEPN